MERISTPCRHAKKVTCYPGSIIHTIVLKTGPNWLVEPIRPRTGGVTDLVDLLDQSNNQPGANRHEPEKLDWHRWGSNRCTTRLKLIKGVMTTASLLLIVINV